MSAWAESAAASLADEHAGARRGEALGLRLLAFLAMAVFAVLQYGTLLQHPPAARLLAVAAIASVGGGALALSARLRVPRAVRWLTGALLVLGTLVAGALVIGIPAHLLAPGRWGSLGQDLHHGFNALAGWLWPYVGGDRWARLAVLLPVPIALAGSAGLCFWPSARWLAARRLAALALLIALFVTGAANQQDPAWGFQGTALVGLVAAWFWLPNLRLAQANRAGGWLLACLVAALALTPLLSARQPWISYGSWNPVSATTAFDWDETFGPIPWSRSEATMFELTLPHAALLRVTALDRFDGERFMRSRAPAGESKLDVPSSGQRAWLSPAIVTVGRLQSNLLVGAGGLPVAERWLGKRGQQITRQADGAAYFASTPADGDSYQVLAYAPAPSAAELRGAPRAFPRVYLPYTRFELPRQGTSNRALGSPGAVVAAPAPGRAPSSDPAALRAIEASPYAPMFALARRLAAGARTSYDVAARVKRYLLSHYTYDERVPRARYPLEAFLFSDSRGYCQQFSGAMALMLRMDGIPARVAAGFRPSVYDPVTQRWRVRAVDAHSWVEVYFSGIGWVSFDPTPPRRVASTSTTAASLSRATVVASGGAGAARSAARIAAATRHRPTGGARGAGVWLVPAALGALLVLAAAGWWLRGARRLRRALGGDGSGAVAELRGALARIGYPLSGATTLAVLEAELQDSPRAGAREYLRRLRELRYASPRVARPGLRERRELRRALADGRGVRGRIKGLVALPPGAARRLRSASD